MLTMDFAWDEINDALISQKYNEVMAIYFLVVRNPPEFEGSESKSSGNFFLTSQPSSDLNNRTLQSSAHLKVHRSISANEKHPYFSWSILSPAISYSKWPQVNSVESEQSGTKMWLIKFSASQLDQKVRWLQAHLWVQRGKSLQTFHVTLCTLEVAWQERYIHLCEDHRWIHSIAEWKGEQSFVDVNN